MRLTKSDLHKAESLKNLAGNIGLARNYAKKYVYPLGLKRSQAIISKAFRYIKW